jgi:hypothetical protein
MSTARLLVLCLTIAFGSTPALASSRVQFQVFYVSFVDTVGKQGQLPLSIALDAPSQQSANAICSVGPRVRDALVVSLRKEIYRLDRSGKMDTAGIALKIRPVIENVVGTENVLDVAVSMDPPKVSAAAASGAFARLGCIGANDQASAAKK